MKSLYKLLFGLAVMFSSVYFCNAISVNASQTVTSYVGSKYQTFEVYDIKEMDWSEWILANESKYENPLDVIESLYNYNHMLVFHYDSGIMQYVFTAGHNSVGSSSTWLYGYYSGFAFYVDYSSGVPIVSTEKSSGSISNSQLCFANKTNIYNSSYDNYRLIGSTYDMFEGKSLSGQGKVSRNNLKHPRDIVYSSADVVVDGILYTVEEPYPYYFVSYSGDEVRLFFSETPFTGTFVDLYTIKLFPPVGQNIVVYSWNKEENNDFLSSRSIVGLGEPYLHVSSAEYSCNYDVYYYDKTDTIILKQRYASLVTYPSITTLYSSLPEELRSYYYCIIFCQDSLTAYDGRILFYAWNDVNANLYINSANSQICAIKGRNALLDVVKAYYDTSLGEWVVSDDVVLGATTDGSFHVPHIFYSDTDLFVADEQWYNTGTIEYMADLERPLIAFDEPVEEEDEGLFGSLISGTKKLLISLFVPSSGYFSSRIERISSKFGFWVSVRDTVNVFVDFLNTTDFTVPPKVEIDLSLINSSIDYGGTAYVLDLTWYEPYKESVDVILSSILWLVFVWNTYKNLPNIIAGIGGGVLATSSLSSASEKGDD